MLYSAFEHREIGWMVRVEDEHRFEDGTAQPGVLLRHRGGAEVWLPKKNLVGAGAER